MSTGASGYGVSKAKKVAKVAPDQRMAYQALKSPPSGEPRVKGTSPGFRSGPLREIESETSTRGGHMNSSPSSPAPSKWKNGIHLHEGMTFEGLIEREAWVFAYVFAPLPIVGATGSPGNPIAVL